MSESTVPTVRDLPPELASAVGELRSLYQSAWADCVARFPRIEDYLDKIEPTAREVLLSELLRSEVGLRAEHGQPVDPDEYRRRFPGRSWLDALLTDQQQTLDEQRSAAESSASGSVRGETLSYARVLAHSDTRAESGAGRYEPIAPSGYTILEELGRGGMGVVYKARHRQLDRIVALKTIRAGADADESELTRFRVEAESVARLQHPHIVQIFEVGEHESRPFFSLEFCSGGTLSTKIGKSPLPPTEAAELVAILARAIHAAHLSQVLHRDLKPANVLLTQDGQPKITDFGLAKKLDQERHQTRTGAAMGTPSYMAPEQARGETESIGPSVDVYALGAILYECLTGRPPFGSASVMDTLMQVIHEPPVPPRRLNPTIQVDLETICMKCLEKEPARRYGSAQALAEELARFSAGEPILARPPGAIERVGKWARRRPAVAALSGAVFLVLLLGMVGTYSQYREAVQGRASALEESRQKGVALRSAVRAKLDALKSEQKALELATKESRARDRAETLLYSSRIAQADQETSRNNFELSTDLLELCNPLRRDWEWRHLRARNRPMFPVRIYDGPPGSISDVAYSPDGTELAVSGGVYGKSGTIWIRNLRDGESVVELIGHRDRVSAVAFSGDGRFLASVSADRTVRVWDVTKGTAIHVLEGHGGQVLDVAFSTDNERIVCAGEDRIVRVWDAKSGKSIAQLEGHTDIVHGVAFSPDGKRVVSCGRDKTVRLWNVEAKSEEWRLLGHSSWVWDVEFGPDGRRLVSADLKGTIKMWDVAERKELFTIDEAHGDSVLAVAFSPDGLSLLSTGRDEGDQSNRIAGTVKHWDSKTGAPVLTVRGHRGGVRCLAFHPRATYYASGGEDGKVWLWDHRLGTEAGSPGTLRGTIRGLALDREGRRVASATSLGVVQFWDAHTGARSTRIETDSGQGGINGLAWSPDGTQLAIVKGLSNSTIEVWNPDTGVLIRQWQAPNGEYLKRLDFSPDSRLLVVGGGTLGKSGMAYVWNASTGALLATLAGHAAVVNDSVFSRDGSLIATASDDKAVKLWNSTSGELIRTLAGHEESVECVGFHPDGRRVVSGDRGGTVHIWESATGKELGTLRLEGESIQDLAFSADGRTLVTGGLGLHFWDLTTRVRVLSVKESTGAVAFSSDGSRVISGGFFGKVMIRHAPEVAQLRTFESRSGIIDGIDFSTDGKLLLARTRATRRGEPGAVSAWNLRTGEAADAGEAPAAKSGFVVFRSKEDILAWVSDVKKVRARFFLDRSDESLERRHREDSWRTRRWHLQRAEIARQLGDSFAVTFHRKRLEE